MKINIANYSLTQVMFFITLHHVFTSPWVVFNKISKSVDVGAERIYQVVDFFKTIATHDNVYYVTKLQLTV